MQQRNASEVPRSGIGKDSSEAGGGKVRDFLDTDWWREFIISGLITAISKECDVVESEYPEYTVLEAMVHDNRETANELGQLLPLSRKRTTSKLTELGVTHQLKRKIRFYNQIFRTDLYSFVTLMLVKNE